ncbi:TolC family outer membrane protein [Phreatobacter stygius]|nr:TolC family outer membrane protein [Phreatobacter stygius]
MSRHATMNIGCRLIAATAATMMAVAPVLAEPARPGRPAQQRAHAETVATLAAAFQRAFRSNPDILAQRASVRATQEAIPQARAGLLPQVSATAYAGVLSARSLLSGTPTSSYQSGTFYQRGVALTATQTLFDGWRTQNSVLQAQAQVGTQREQMRAIEQAVLLDVATTYLAVATGQALVEVQRRNVGFLTETLTTTRTRLASGVATPTDVAQAEARLSRGLADLSSTETDLSIARDRFLRIVGAPPAARLAPASAVDRLIPRSRDASRDIAGQDNPAVLAAISSVKSAESAIRVAQGQMLPQLSMQAQVARDIGIDVSTLRTDSAQVVGRLTVPLYAGGAPEAQVRQARELLGQAQMQLDSARVQSRSVAFAGHAALDNATFTIRAATAEVRAADVTVEGVRKQADAGLRTLTELLNAQQDSVNARARLLQAQSDRLVASYTILAATGRLELPRLGVTQPAVGAPPPQSDLGVRSDAWGELRNPTGPARPASAR